MEKWQTSVFTISKRKRFKEIRLDFRFSFETAAYIDIDIWTYTYIYMCVYK